jgi:S1-C subfamily serine protease
VTEYGATKPLPATLIGFDQTKDMALLKINNASNLPTVTFGNSSKAVVGDSVVAIGNALGLSAGTPTVTQGIVSALGRTVTAGGIGTQTETLTNMIQTDAAINAGNSGGPLIDTAGQVIGMNTAVAGTSSDGTNSQNIGFAIPVAQVAATLPELQKGGQTGNGGGYLGVDITTLTPALRQQYGFTPTSGAVVLSVVAGSPTTSATASARPRPRWGARRNPSSSNHSRPAGPRIRSVAEGSPASGTPDRPGERPSYQSGAAPGMSKFRSGWAGGKFISPPRGCQPLASMSSSTWAML